METHGDGSKLLGGPLHSFPPPFAERTRKMTLNFPPDREASGHSLSTLKGFRTPGAAAQ